MATAPTQIRIDAETKQQAMALFNELGLDMSSVVNLFCISASCGKGCRLLLSYRNTVLARWRRWKRLGVFPATRTCQRMMIWQRKSARWRNEMYHLKFTSEYKRAYKRMKKTWCGSCSVR